MMASILSSTSSVSRPFGPSSRPTRLSCHHVVRACASSSQAATPSRREALGAAAGVLLLLNASKADAFLGIGENSEEVYKADTSKIVEEVKKAIAMDQNNSAKEDTMENVRTGTNAWVAKYRRAGFTGRPSYGNTYTALNALAGHFNSFGTTAPLPKKRLERIQKELDDATKMLGRGR